MKSFILKVCCLFLLGSVYATSLSASPYLQLYQPDATIDRLVAELDFWRQRSLAAPRQQAFKVQLAHANTALFSATAAIKYLKRAEQLLSEVVAYEAHKNAKTLRALAHNYISQHRFCEAMNLVVQAQALGSEKRATALILFDLYGELGDEAAQQSILAELEQQKDFHYYIRLAKWQDGQGELEQAISAMQRAETIAQLSRQTSLQVWVYTNLADYYGHAGEIEQSRNYYLKALALNPADWYSMKGLAWMSYAHDRDPVAASAILAKIAERSVSPSIALLQAEIMEFQGKTGAAKAQYEEVAQTVHQPAYGQMYNQFLCEYYLSQQRMELALQRAQQEVALRAVPAAYDLLAQVYYAQGKIEAAQQISKQYIWDQTFEPNILKQQLVYFQGKEQERLTQIRSELEAARYEIGPLAYQKIK